MSGGLIVRPLIAADAPERRELRLEALRDFPSAFGSTLAFEQDWPLERFARAIDPADGIALGVFDGARLAGTGIVRRDDAPAGLHWGGVRGMYVRPAYWSTGAADMIMSGLIDYAHGKMEFLELSVTEGNERAHRFYRRHGFAEYGRRPRGLRHGGRDYDEILMMLELARRP